MEFDASQPARYGSLDPLESGFLPDPVSVAIEPGGPIDARYLGGACVGFAETNPDYEVRYVAGSGTLLRFYFVSDTAGDDATLIINDSSGNWVCADDSYGGTDPTIDFASPSGGWYDIWVGNYMANAFISGTLYITELDSNHP